MTEVSQTKPTSGLPQYGIYVLGAGFSRPAGLPVAGELWSEILQRAVRMEGRAAKFRRDLDNYIEFRERCFGEQLNYESVNFEQFLGHLDVEFHLGLRGSETWSQHGNEGQVIVKTLIGQVLTERTPSSDRIPELYLQFASSLKPRDLVITFNYDILLERALERCGVKFRLFTDRYKHLHRGGGGILAPDDDEVVVLKVHGSLDWFDRLQFLQLMEMNREDGFKDYVPTDPVFNRDPAYSLSHITDGPRPIDDPLREMFRLKEIEHFYQAPPWFLSCPSIVNPSTEKVLHFNRAGSYFHGMNQLGTMSMRLAIIGYSLPDHDAYARQVLYHIVSNYQGVSSTDIHPDFPPKKPLAVIDFHHDASAKADFKKRYRFVDWDNAILRSDGYSAESLAAI